MKSFKAFLSIGLIAIGCQAAHAAEVRLSKSDFSGAHQVVEGKQALVLADLSASGDEKMTVLNQHLGSPVVLAVGGEIYQFTLRAPILDHQLQAGPLTVEAARHIVDEINRH